MPFIHMVSQPSRIPSRRHSYPTWNEARLAVQSRSTCPVQPQAPHVHCCWQSAEGSCLTVAVRISVGSASGTRGPAGASSMYRQRPDETAFLCPDCLWAWVRAMSECPRGRAANVCDPALFNHIRMATESCQLGGRWRFHCGTKRSSPAHTPQGYRRGWLRQLSVNRASNGLPLSTL